MAINSNASKEYLAMMADETNDAAFTSHLNAEIKAQAKWDAICDGEAKDSAYDNADEMTYAENLIPANDKLGWLRAAIDSYEMNA